MQLFSDPEQAIIYCRIYDKVLEVKKKNKKLWFFTIWEKKGLNIENVWNIEFEIKRDFFKERNMESVEDAFKHLRDIWEYCSKKMAC